jgi:hypothetical protein
MSFFVSGDLKSCQASILENAPTAFFPNIPHDIYGRSIKSAALFFTDFWLNCFPPLS